MLEPSALPLSVVTNPSPTTTVDPSKNQKAPLSEVTNQSPSKTVVASKIQETSSISAAPLRCPPLPKKEKFRSVFFLEEEGSIKKKPKFMRKIDVDALINAKTPDYTPQIIINAPREDSNSILFKK